MKPIARTAVALAAMLASFSASALGLGQIDVKSKLGQPLVAEIPIVSSDPTELEQLQAGLASPATFARIGLRPPIGLVAELQFTQGLDARGNPVIRVTSAEPVNEQLLTFLVEVDWGQGRLVREYSALIDAPRTVSAPLQPEIQAPTVEAPALVERPVAAAPEPLAEEAGESDQAGSAEPERTSAGESAPAQRAEAAPAAAAATPPAPAAPVERSPAPGIDGEYRVQQGDTLSGIAAQMGAGSLDQSMIALLRANPDAFIGGNIHRLKAGAVLRAPGPDALTALDARQARALVQAQTREWRDSRRTTPQPAALADAPQRVGANGGDPDTQPARVADARLEIVPPGASEATKAGTQSGISAGGEGAMLQQELTQTRETLAAREAEAQELKSRVEELEKLQKQQQQLIVMKDSELAAAQARLAQAQDPQSPASVLPWILAVIAALAVGFSFAWLLRRRDAARPRFRVPASSPLAEAFAAPAEDGAAVRQVAGSPVHAVAASAVEESAAEESAAKEPAVQKPAVETPFAADVEAPARTEPPIRETATRAAPAWHSASASKHAGQGDLLSGEAQASHERLELARAYLDLGDLASARQLLGEIIVNGDLAARQQATRMLRELE